MSMMEIELRCPECDTVLKMHSQRYERIYVESCPACLESECENAVEVAQTENVDLHRQIADLKAELLKLQKER